MRAGRTAHGAPTEVNLGRARRDGGACTGDGARRADGQHAMITVLSFVAARLVRSQVGRLVALGILCLLAGAEAFAVTQHEPFTTGLYWAITTATTLGPLPIVHCSVT